MRVEEEFDIAIEDQEAELLATPGALCALIERKSGLKVAEKTSFCPTSRAFYHVRRELMHLGIERKYITPRTSLEVLLPREQRRQKWQTLGSALKTSLPPLHRSPQWAFIGLLPLGVLPFLLMTTGTFLSALYAFLWWLGLHATKSFAVHTPSECSSIGDLCYLLAPRFHEHTGKGELDVWSKLQLIIADECSLPVQKVARDAHFIYDLGLD